VKVECQSVEEGLEAAAAGADIIMLDNFNAENMLKGAKEIKSKFPNTLIEASGVS
jgi:nicotinate-nucleotide pyrophosphorylase (carboxylating)